MKFSDIAPASWKNNSGGLAYSLWLDEFCDKHIKDSTVLLVGLGSTREQVVDYPDAFKALGAKSIEFLEVWAPYIKLWRRLKYKITHGDVRNIDKLFAPMSIDVIMFTQGPEHLRNDEMPKVLEAMFNTCRKAVLCTCPYGGAYDYQEDWGGNPYERHVQKSMTEESFKDCVGFNTKALGVKDALDGSIVIWREREQCPK